MKTGIIMEINERFLTLLTPEGEFLRAQKLNRQYHIGEEINFYPISEKEKEGWPLTSIFSSFKAKTITAALVMLVLVTSSFFTFNGHNEVYAYMSIDINPSIELGINDKFQVIEISPYNEEGEEIVNQIPNWKKKSVKEVTSQIVKQIKNQGYTRDNYEIVIATVNTQKENKALETKFEKEITEIKETIQKEELEVKVMDASPKEREKAKEHGLSTGAYKETEIKKQPENMSRMQKTNNNENKKSNANDASKNKTNGINNNIEIKTPPPGQLQKEQNLNQPKGFNNQGKQPVEKKTPPGQEKKQQQMHNNNNGSNQENQKKNNQETNSNNNKNGNKRVKPSNGNGNGKGNPNSKSQKHKEVTNPNKNGKEKDNHNHQNDD